MRDAASSLADLFPEGDYRFHLALRRGEPREFFAPRDPDARILAERKRWLGEGGDRYAALQSEGEPIVREFAALAATWGMPVAGGSALEVLRALGGAFEPDLLFLSRDAEGSVRLRGGALCFPTGWALEEKLGLPLEAIHGVVPGLNPAIGAQIQQFLSRLKPGVAFLRDNWGLAATDELNLHPVRRVPPPALPVSLDRLWLRVEHQALLALPASGGIVFGIRIVSHRLDDVVTRGFGAPLRHALKTMPAQLADYKRLSEVRDYVVHLL